MGENLTCTDSLGQAWTSAAETGVAAGAGFLYPPLGAKTGGITSVTCQPVQDNFSYSPDYFLSLMLDFYEIKGASLIPKDLGRQYWWTDNSEPTDIGEGPGTIALYALTAGAEDNTGTPLLTVTPGKGFSGQPTLYVSEVITDTGFPYYRTEALASEYKIGGSTAGTFSLVYSASYGYDGYYAGAAYTKAQYVEATLSDWPGDSIRVDDLTPDKGASLPLGGSFKIRLFSYDDSGKKVIEPSTYSFGINGQYSFTGGIGLFPDSAVLKYAGSTSKQGLFQAVHTGYAPLLITPEDTSKPPINLSLFISNPASLGSSHPEVDPIIYPFAQQSGIPPQYIKAQMAQESGINPMSYRYEPFTSDEKVISRGMDLRKKNPYALYRLATVADSQDGSLPVGTKLLPADIAPSGVFNIPVGAQYVSACQIVKLNNGWAHWTKKDKKGVDRTNNLCKDDFTAQTTIASSYGYMQVLYSTAIAPMQWTGNPSLLFDTSANLASDRGSLSLGTSYLQTLCWKVDTVDFYADGGNVSWQNEDDMRSAFEQAWIKYNGGEEYGGKVSDRVDTYLPVPSSTTVFGVTQ